MRYIFTNFKLFISKRKGEGRPLLVWSLLIPLSKMKCCEAFGPIFSRFTVSFAGTGYI